MNYYSLCFYFYYIFITFFILFYFKISNNFMKVFVFYLYDFYLNSTISLYDLKVNIIFVYSFNKQEYFLN